MKSSGKIGATLAVLCLSGQVLAQPGPGYEVSWGAHMVPLSPWLNALIVLMLILATYAFLRKRAGRGLMLLAGTLLVGGMVMHTDKAAFSIIDPTTITTPSGSMTLYCTQTYYLETTVPGGVRLTVTPINFVPASVPASVTPSNGVLECTTGTYLNPGSQCYLCTT